MKWEDNWPRPLVAETVKKFHPVKPRIPVGIISQGCPRCGGSLIQEPDESGDAELTCVNCSRIFDPQNIR